MAERKPTVAVVMGSDSDWPILQETVSLLKKLGIPSQVRVLSAHRCPDEVAQFARSAEGAGLKVIIAAAGAAAHLAGAIASQTILPVIGIPLDPGTLGGLDALLSTVQMPGGIPVATVAIGKPGAKNAAILAAEILSLSDKNLAKKLESLRAESKKSVIAKDRLIQKKASQGQ